MKGTGRIEGASLYGNEEGEAQKVSPGPFWLRRLLSCPGNKKTGLNDQQKFFGAVLDRSINGFIPSLRISSTRNPGSFPQDRNRVFSRISLQG